MNKMKKILFILHVPPPVHGSSMVGQSIRKSKLINESFDCSFVNLLVSRSINDTGKWSFMKVLRFVGIWVHLMLELIVKKPEVCYLALSTTGLSFYKDVLLVFWLRLFRVKRIYHLHNKGISKRQTNKVLRLLYQFVFKGADVILLSNYLYKDIETFVPLSRVHICPNGIEDSFINLKPRLPAIESPVKMLFLSNLIESKGVTVLLDACVILQKKGLDFRCNFVGAEGDMNAIQFDEKVKQHGMEARVKYLGRKFGQDKQAILADTDIFAFPTYYSNECFPLVLLEAMSASVAVVSTFEGGIPDIIEDGLTGFLVPQRDVGIMAEKLEELIKNSALRQQMGKAGRQKFETEFTLEIFEYKLQAILHQIAEKNM
jgi:glycosyltransferase involved in cell wall biosynthesis